MVALGVFLEPFRGVVIRINGDAEHVPVRRAAAHRLEQLLGGFEVTAEARAEGRERASGEDEGEGESLALEITDPDYDTPERLKEYSARYHADPQHWDYLTAPLIDITAIGEQFGLQFWRANPAEPINHNVRSVVVDANGIIQWITPDNDFKPDVLAEQMVKAAWVKSAK